MSYFDKAETDAFLKVFLSNSGDGLSEKEARAFIRDLTAPDVSEADLRDRYAATTYTVVTDAMNTWNAGVRFAWSKTIEGMR